MILGQFSQCFGTNVSVYVFTSWVLFEGISAWNWGFWQILMLENVIKLQSISLVRRLRWTDAMASFVSVSKLFIGLNPTPQSNLAAPHSFRYSNNPSFPFISFLLFCESKPLFHSHHFYFGVCSSNSRRTNALTVKSDYSCFEVSYNLSTRFITI